MPGLTVGTYVGQLDAGTQVSSTYEGRYLTVREDELIHPYIADGYVNKGDPVVVCDAAVPATYGNIVGVAMNSGSAAADLISIDTEGIWNLKVDAYDNAAAGSAVEIGDCLYIRAGTLGGTTSVLGTGDAELSKINDAGHQVFFGYALGSMVATGSGRIAVKVHASPFPEMEERRYQTTLTGGLGFRRTAIFAGGASEGLFYEDAQVTGLQTGLIYAWGRWLELAAGFTSNGSTIVVDEMGIYDAGATIVGDARIVMQQMLAPLATTPDTFHWFRLNLQASGGAATAIFASANFASIGYIADVVDNAGANKLGNVPLFNDAGLGICYVEVFSA